MHNTLAVDHFPENEVACYAEAMALVRAGMRFMGEPMISSSTGTHPHAHAKCREDIVQWIGQNVRANGHVYGAFVARVAPVLGGKNDSFAVPAEEVTAAFSDYRHELKKSFDALFTQFRQGVSLLPSDEMRRLAAVAAQTRNQQVDVGAWARRLSGDMTGADD